VCVNEQSSEHLLNFRSTFLSQQSRPTVKLGALKQFDISGMVIPFNS